MSGTNRLSPEILVIIFQHIVDTSTWNEKNDTLSQCQLVCHSWSRPARTSFYDTMVLPPGHIEKFAQVVRQAGSTIGPLIKTIDFCPEAILPGRQFYPNMAQDIHTILEHCSRLEKLGSSSTASVETYFIWPALDKLQDNQFERLEQFRLRNDWPEAQTSIYGSLSLKCKKSLIMLQLYPDPKSDDVNQDVNFTALKRNLKEFVSLKELQLCGAFVKSPIITELDGLINDCPRTTHSLLLSECKFLHTHDYPNEIKENSSIKTLKLQRPKLSAASLCYLAKKLPGLETLTVTRAVFDLAQPETQEQYGEWRNALIDLCQPLQHYDISIDDFDPREYLLQIRDCADMTKNIANCAKKPTKFTMYLGKSGDLKHSHILEMDQNGSRVGLFNLENREIFRHRAIFPEIFQTVQPFSPQTINILDVEDTSIFKDLLNNDQLNTYLIQLLSVKNWAIFNGVFSLINGNTESVVHLDKMAFPGSQEDFDPIIAQELVESTSISEFKFTNCLFYSNVLCKMLSKLPKVDALILHECITKSDSPYQLDIDLPETKLGRLELNLNSVFHSGSFFHLQGTVKICLTIAGVTTTHCKQIGTRKDKSAPKFRFSINCKDLQSLVISGEEIFTSSVIEALKIPSMSTLYNNK